MSEVSTFGIVGDVLHLAQAKSAEIEKRSGGRTRVRLCAVAASVAAMIASVVMMAGCGDNYRPVVSAIGVTGPAGQPTKYAVAVSSATPIPQGQSCPLAGQASAPGLLTMVDFSGDTTKVTAVLGTNPFYLALNSNGTTGYTLNCDRSLNSFDLSTSLITSDVLRTTLWPKAQPVSLFATSSSQIYIADPGTDAVDQLYGAPPAQKQDFLTDSGFSPVYVVGQSGAARDFIINQAINGGPGEVSTIDTSLNMISTTLPVGSGPVYGVMTADNRRAFILNQADNTVSVINTQTNMLDQFKDSYHNSPISSFSISGGVVTFQSANPPQSGQVTISGLSTGTYLDGQTLTVASATPTQFTAAFAHADVASTNDTGTATLAGLLASTIPVGTHPVWADLASGLNELVVLNQGPVFTITGYSIATNVITFSTTPQNLGVGNTVTLSGFPTSTTSTFLNGATVTVLSTGLASNSFQALLTHPNVSLTNESGAGFTGDGTGTGSVTLVNIPLCTATALPTNPACDANNPVDASTFGQVVKTIPVGVNPIMVSVLSDYSQAYVINAGIPGLPCATKAVAGVSTTCTVSAVNLSTDTVTATIPIDGHPAWIATANSTPTGKVYVVCKDSQVMTVIDTDTDTLHLTIPLQGYGISVRMTVP